MKNKKFAFYLHLVWATWDREPWILPEIDGRVYRNISKQVHEKGCKILAIYDMPNHIHLVVKLSTTTTIVDLVKKAKGVSSRFINEIIKSEDHFRWQIGYGAFTISRWDFDKIIYYVRNQKSHHNNSKLVLHLEEVFDRS